MTSITNPPSHTAIAETCSIVSEHAEVVPPAGGAVTAVGGCGADDDEADDGDHAATMWRDSASALPSSTSAVSRMPAARTTQARPIGGVPDGTPRRAIGDDAE